MTTIQQAIDEMFGVFKTSWDTVGYPVAYPDKFFEIPADRTPWARINIQHVIGGQTTLSNSVGNRNFEREGFISIQIFTPVGNGLQLNYTLANMLLNAYEKANSNYGVWYKNARIQEAGRDGDWQQSNVLIDFCYTEII